MTAINQSGGSQFDSRECSDFDFRFSKFELGSSKGIKFVILVEDFDTFLLFCALIVAEWGLMRWGRKSHSYFCSWCYSRKWGYGISPTPSLVFALSGPFHYHKSYARNLQNQRQWEYWGHGPLWLHPRPRHPPKTTGYIHHSNHSTRSWFLHTTQLQAKTILKRRIQFQNHNFKVHQPSTHDLTNHHNHTIYCDTETQRTPPNPKILKLTSKSSPSLLMPLSLPHQHSIDRLNKHACLHSRSPQYFQERLWSHWASSRKNLEIGLYPLPSKDPPYNYIFSVYILLYMFLIELSQCIYFTTTSTHKEIVCS